ncbi:CadD family cadmium resistance transporter [Streptococcus thoraltensis]|uniref:CadD family cadmium resistance transporter n=1 Tax=Streptococcus thoraltensis TaxID=55085 RepID=UPI00037FA4FE|nr:CadD family cadmium resistance transporter [Streptococcus thoraltensis]MDY4762437.1 CadD family cadmium resistance transporter [Streptococcus thoraltensis]
MFQTLFSALAVFISTSIDYVVLLLIVFASLGRKQFLKVLIGQYIGISLLVIVSLVIAYLFHFIPEDWMIGLLGLIPIALGIRFAMIDKDENDDETEEVMAQLHRGKYLAVTVTSLTLAAGGDNLGVYIPYFSGMSSQEVSLVILVFIVAIFILNWLTYQVAATSLMSRIVENLEKWFLPLVFIGLGIYILIENGTIQHFLEIL